ncbi:MAG: Fibronectin, type domain protein [Marmoricola sp.]|nr:Fibronectin, type domain protein [Marmoricola sp.]
MSSTIGFLVITPPRLRRACGTAFSSLLLVALTLGLVASAGSSADARVGSTARTTRHVIDNGPWPPFTASFDAVWKAYQESTGTQRALLAKIALRPRVQWFTATTQNGNAAATIRERIGQFQQGDPNAYAQFAIFGLYPNGEGRRSDPISAAQQARYRTWINQIAQGIGTSKVILVLEPDLAVAWGGWRPGVRFALAAYAAKVLGALPNTTVYLDGSDADWLKPAKAVLMLRRSGIAHVDGIALGATHYWSTSANIRYGVNLIHRLAAVGIANKTLVIDTADNARPFTTGEFKRRFPYGAIGNANLCTTMTETHCVTLGIPPTTDVASPRWGLSATDRALAAQYVDAYLWFGRPWLFKQASPFMLSRALAVARTTPYPMG